LIGLNPNDLVTGLAGERENVASETTELEQLSARLIALNRVDYVQKIVGLAILLL
jgi:hypothetical protein